MRLTRARVEPVCARARKAVLRQAFSRGFARQEGRPSRRKIRSRQIGYALESTSRRHHVAEVPLAVLSLIVSGQPDAKGPLTVLSVEDMTTKSRFTLHTLTLLSAAFMTTAGFAKPATNAPQKLTPDGEQAMAEYTEMLDGLRAGLKAKLPQIDKAQEAAFLETYEKEKGAVVTGKDKNGRPTQSLKGRYCQELCSRVLNQAAFCSTPSVKILPSRTRTIW